MADESRPLAVSPERVDAVSRAMFDNTPFCNLPRDRKVQAIQTAMLSEQVELLRNIDFFLNEAYDIYNARFR